MKEDIKFFGSFISKCFEVLKVEIFDWGFNFADLLLTGLLILATLFFVKTFIGMPASINWHKPNTPKVPENDISKVRERVAHTYTSNVANGKPF